jgi:hypothetical protein
VGVTYDGEHVMIVNHQLWRPTKNGPVRIQDIEEFLLSLRQRYRVKRIYCDPWQAAGLIQRLQGKFGSVIEEFPQTSGNLTIATEELFRLISSRNLIAYHDTELEKHVLNAVTVDSSRGVRLAKEKASRKIDLCVALAMACAAAVQHGKSLSTYAYPVGPIGTTRKTPFGDSVFGHDAEIIPSDGIEAPMGVGNSGISLGGDDYDCDERGFEYIGGTKPRGY